MHILWSYICPPGITTNCSPLSGKRSSERGWNAVITRSSTGSPRRTPISRRGFISFSRRSWTRPTSSTGAGRRLAKHRRTRDWLEKEGFAIAARAAAAGGTTETTTPEEERAVAYDAPPRRETFVGLLRRLTGADPGRLAAELEITPDFLIDLSRNGRVLPMKARGELAKRARKASGTEESLVLASFELPDARAAPSDFRRAASRVSEYAATSLTYVELVQRSSMDDARSAIGSTLLAVERWSDPVTHREIHVAGARQGARGAGARRRRYRRPA